MRPTAGQESKEATQGYQPQTPGRAFGRAWLQALIYCRDCARPQVACLHGGIRQFCVAGHDQPIFSTVMRELADPRAYGKFLSPLERASMAEYEDQLPESQIGRAQWLADELTLCGHEDISAVDLLDALATLGLKLMPDTDGISSHEYMGAHKSVIRSPKADLN